MQRGESPIYAWWVALKKTNTLSLEAFLSLVKAELFVVPKDPEDPERACNVSESEITTLQKRGKSKQGRKKQKKDQTGFHFFISRFCDWH